VPDTLDEDSKACTMCTEAFGGGDCEPLRLQCGQLVCRSCLEVWARSKPLEDLQCPFCSQEVLPAETLRALVFGLDRRGYYVFGTRFTAWENFERSCADLDCHLAINTTRAVWIQHVDLRVQALEILIEGALLQRKTSAPVHLQNGRLYMAPSTPSSGSCVS